MRISISSISYRLIVTEQVNLQEMKCEVNALPQTILIDFCAKCPLKNNILPALHVFFFFTELSSLELVKDDLIICSVFSPVILKHKYKLQYVQKSALSFRNKEL